MFPRKNCFFRWLWQISSLRPQERQESEATEGEGREAQKEGEEGKAAGGETSHGLTGSVFSSFERCGMIFIVCDTADTHTVSRKSKRSAFLDFGANGGS